MTKTGSIWRGNTRSNAEDTPQMLRRGCLFPLRERGQRSEVMFFRAQNERTRTWFLRSKTKRGQNQSGRKQNRGEEYTQIRSLQDVDKRQALPIKSGEQFFHGPTSINQSRTRPRQDASTVNH